MIRFGTGGWRAIIGDGFTKRNIQLLTAGLCALMKDEGVAGKGLCIGYDRRFLSKEAAQWAAEVSSAAGIGTGVIHREAPTPLVMYTVREQGLHYGMMITASHNPALYNGIKIFTEGGRDADKAVTDLLEKYIDRIEAAEPCTEPPTLPWEEGIRSGIVRVINPFNEYIDSILALVDAEAIRRAGLKVALDPMYGVSQTSLKTILLTARCEVEVIHERHDTLFGGKLPAPNVDTLESLARFVRDNGCDLGIATDGDADRIGVIDDTGAFLHPNRLLVILYYYLLEYRGWRGPAVRNTSTTHLLDRVAAAYGQVCYEVPVGFKHISGKMAETGAVIGGESSGGLTVRGHIQGKDGIYAAALLVEMIATTGRRLSEIYREITDKYGSFEMEERDYSFSPAEKERISRLLMTDKLLPEFARAVEKVSYADGCKVYFKDGGWIICRFSGTEPLMRIFCEMEDLAQARGCIAGMEQFLGLKR